MSSSSSGSSNNNQSTLSGTKRPFSAPESNPQSGTNRQPGTSATSGRPQTSLAGFQISVSPRQKGNPLLTHLKNVPWKYADIVSDYFIPATSSGRTYKSPEAIASGSTTQGHQGTAGRGSVLAASTASNVLYLSLKYYRIHPEYITGRMAKLGYEQERNDDDVSASGVGLSGIHFARILLVVVDIENPAETLKEITRLSFARDFTMVLAWNNADAANYITQLKTMQNASLDPSAKNYDTLTGMALLNGGSSGAYTGGSSKNDSSSGSEGLSMSASVYNAHVIETVTKVRGINKTDAQALIAQYGSLSNAFKDGASKVENIGGWGATKAKRFQDAITKPFINREWEEEDKEVGYDEDEEEEEEDDDDEDLFVSAGANRENITTDNDDSLTIEPDN
ncbi:uncharacterized protein SAPINGB_P004048 [Magnusiomyces paraingens]|uniref:ERCC1-like central domain-containing protein n=1 Tax=Magnusiomyces paraingens TaxID=2606893 RepID=A0A5E8BSH9_9ASCO|nr:uncharacterized protein SAPINGB_P004048 [Saprochaete ingens]VVT54383.1 unnamed protein product [Saprochaete ingens]